MKDSEINCEVAMDIVFDKAVGESYSVASRYTIDDQGHAIYDRIWGKLTIPEYSIRIAAIQFRRIKPWIALPTSEFVRFMNMKRKNKAYDKVVTQQITQTGHLVRGRKVYRSVLVFLDRENDYETP